VDQTIEVLASCFEYPQKNMFLTIGTVMLNFGVSLHEMNVTEVTTKRLIEICGMVLKQTDDEEVQYRILVSVGTMVLKAGSRERMQELCLAQGLPDVLRKLRSAQTSQKMQELHKELADLFGS